MRNLQAVTAAAAPLVLCELAETGVEGIDTYSPFCLKVHRALRAAGLTYTSRRVARPADLRELNRAEQVPVLLVGDEVVVDSTAILARIEQLVPGSIDPRDRHARAESWLWEEFADRSLSGFVAAARWADPKNWPLVRDAYFAKAPWLVRWLVVPRIREHVLRGLVARDVVRHGMEATWADFRRVLDLLELRAPRTGFWVSDQLSAADFGLFGQLHALRTHLTASQAHEIVLRPQLTDYLDRVDDATRRNAREVREEAARALDLVRFVA